MILEAVAIILAHSSKARMNASGESVPFVLELKLPRELTMIVCTLCSVVCDKLQACPARCGDYLRPSRNSISVTPIRHVAHERPYCDV